MLNQWSTDDRVLREEFSADNEKLDTALSSLSTQTAAKASQEEVNGLKNVVASKADKSAVETLTSTVNAKASQSDLSSLSTTVGTKASQTELINLNTTVTSLTSTVNTKASQNEVSALRGDITAGDLWVKVADFTSTTVASTISFDLSGIDFTDYWQPRFSFQFTAASNVLVTLNNDSGKNYLVHPLNGNNSSTNYLFAPHLSGPNIPFSSNW